MFSHGSFDARRRPWDAGRVSTDLDTLRDAWSVERSRIVQQIADLEHRFNDIVDAAELTSTDDEHDPEGATIAYERAQVSALLRHARADLFAIDEASELLNAGRALHCSECGAPIPVERLLALPGTRTCVSCAR